MAFLKRDFVHSAPFGTTRTRKGALNLFHDVDGKLVAAYSYNTALAVVLPDDTMTAKVRLYLNRTTYSKCSNDHMWTILRILRGSYGDIVVDAAADTYTLAVGSSANDLVGACGHDVLPAYVRYRPLAGHTHLTNADLRRAAGRHRFVASDDGSEICVTLKDAEGNGHQIRVDASGPDISVDADDGDYTLSPDLYRWLVNTRLMAMAVAEARGSANRDRIYSGTYYGVDADLTYSKRSV